MSSAIWFLLTGPLETFTPDLVSCPAYNTLGAASPPPQMFGCLGVWIRSSSTIHHSPLILHTFPRQVRRRPPQARSGDTVLRVPHAQREGYRTARSEFHKYAWHTCGLRHKRITEITRRANRLSWRELPAHVADVNTDHRSNDTIPLPADCIEDLSLREGLSSLRIQEPVDIRLGLGHGRGRLALRIMVCTFKHRRDPRQQQGFGRRLRNIVIGTKAKPFDLVLF